jgi:hypothetical protein
MASRLPLCYGDFAESHIKGDEKPWTLWTFQLSPIQSLIPKEPVHFETISPVRRSALYTFLMQTSRISLANVQFARLRILKSNLENC